MGSAIGHIRAGVFQHTAARRRLGQIAEPPQATAAVSTHSRPKAAGIFLQKLKMGVICFNTQPPEGGWLPAHAP